MNERESWRKDSEGREKSEGRKACIKDRKPLRFVRMRRLRRSVGETEGSCMEREHKGEELN